MRATTTRTLHFSPLACGWYLSHAITLLCMLCALCGCLLLLPGCGGDGKVTMRDTMGFLQAGQARGHVNIASGGSPLGAGMKQTFFLGPEDQVITFDGDIDFSEMIQLPDAKSESSASGGGETPGAAAPGGKRGLG